MDANPTENRKHERVEFFLVPVDREQIPVWLFKPEPFADQIAGVILNMSAGGLQVLTHVESELDAPSYQIRLLLQESDVETQFTGQARRVWTQAHGKLCNLHGFEFTSQDSTADVFLRQLRPSVERRNWVRCLLVRC